MKHRNPGNHNLFASDLDGTLIPVDADPTYPGAVAELDRRLSRAPHVKVAFVTGRNADEALAAAADRGLPVPYAVCCDVGTKILRRVDGAYVRDEDYHARALAALGSATAADVLEAVVGATGFSVQNIAAQTDVKMSFHLPEGDDASAELETVRRLTADRGWTLSLVASRCVYTRRTLLDVLPGGIDKATAVHHLRKSLGLEPEAVLYAGDSGNDLAPLTAGFRAVVPSNAARDVAGSILRFAADEGRPERVFLADRPHLHGVLQGAGHFGVF